MLRWFLADLKTGRQLLDLRPMRGTWERFLNAPETIECTLNMWDPDTIALHPRVSAAAGRSVLAVASGDTILGAGPIWGHDYDRANGTLKLTARGLWSYYDHRFVIPVVAATIGVDQFVIPDDTAAGKTKPNPALGTYLTGWELGTIAKKWVQQAHEWTGGSVPVVFEADRAATADEDHERNFEGAEFKRLGTVISQLTEVEGGPDIMFKPRLTADRLGIEWGLITGTEASPFIHGDSTHLWDLTVPKSGISRFNIKHDGSVLAGTAWVTGGRSGDTVMVGRSIDSTLTDLGYPLFERLDSSHSSVSVQGTLDRYAAEATTLGRGPQEEWSFTVEANQQPYLGAFWEGDYCDVDVAPYGAREIITNPPTDEDGMFAPETLGLSDTLVDGGLEPTGLTLGSDGMYDVSARERLPLVGDPYLYEGGTFRHRIIGIGGDMLGLTVDVKLAPVQGV